MAPHARLSASAAHRWLACPGSVDGPAGAASSAAEEGTAAHDMALACLKGGQDAWEYIGQRFNGMWEVTLDMADAVQVYLDHVRSLPGTHAYETLLPGDPVHPDMGGTADCVVDDGTTLHVVDYKHGAGVFVSVDDNPQLKIYALLWLALRQRPKRKVVITIVQPRAGGRPVRDHEMTSDDLYRWEKETLLPAAGATGKRDYKPGEHCRFCPKRATCPALKRLAKDIGAMEPETTEFLSDAELAAAWASTKQLKVWIAAVEAEAYKRLMAGKKVDGLKIVEGRSLRQFKDGADAAAKAAFGEQAFTAPELKSPAQIEKLPGGKAFTNRWAFSPPGKLTVAEASDPRPEAAILTLADELMLANQKG